MRLGSVAKAPAVAVIIEHDAYRDGHALVWSVGACVAVHAPVGLRRAPQVVREGAHTGRGVWTLWVD